jgi:hypothetical protein
MNAAVGQLNGVLSQVANEMAGLVVIYVDGFQSAYDTHRFCEPASNQHLQAPIGRSTWFWHHKSPGYLNGGEGPDGLSTTGFETSSQEVLDALIQDKLVQATINENNPPWNVSNAFQSEDALYSALNQAAGNGTIGTNVLPESMRRVLHPKGSAYTPYANAFLAAIKANRGPATTMVTAPKPAYATGRCCFHMDEWEDCNPMSDDLYANITLVDNNKKIIYQTPQQNLANGGLGDPINDGNHTTIQGPLPYPIHVTGEHEHDYIQFTYGTLSWTSRGTSGPATCSNAGWNPRDGPICDGLFGYAPAENQMDCCFPC